MRMARVNVYLPEDLAEAVREAGLNVSGIAQDALVEALSGLDADQWLGEVARLPRTDVTHDSVVDAVDEARAEFGI